MQSEEKIKHKDSLYGDVQKLWGVLAPGRKINPKESAFFAIYSPRDGGIKAESGEQKLFCALLSPYKKSLFPDLNRFLISLSLAGESDEISFRMRVSALPAELSSEEKEPYPMLEIMELPEQKYGDTIIPYNVFVLAENRSKLYTGILDQELVGFDSEKRELFKKFGTCLDEPKGDPMWRRNFVRETLKLLTKVAEGKKEQIVNWNKDQQINFKRREEKIPWLSRIFSENAQLGAVYPENVDLRVHRTLSYNLAHSGK